MKILAIHSITDTYSENESAIDIWRIWRPLEELKKHVDWQIDYKERIVPEGMNLESADGPEIDTIGRELDEYDVIFTSYQPSPALFALLHSVENRYGTKLILDMDDDMFNIPDDSMFWLRATKRDAFMMQRMLKLCKNISTTTATLKQLFEEGSEVEANVVVTPNYLPDSYTSRAERDEKVVIGFFGGSSHYYDLHETGVLTAVKKLMFNYKNVHFVSAGLPIDYYLPKARTHMIQSAVGRKWTDELFPSLNFDISIAPLRKNKFNEAKSNIKWLESTRMGAAFVASNIGPYKELDKKTAIAVANTDDDWYRALESLVLDKNKRCDLVENSQKILESNWRLEDNWQVYKNMFETVVGKEQQ